MAHKTFRNFLLGASLAVISVSGCTKPPTKEEKMVAELIERKQLLPASREERDAIASKDMLTQAAFWGDQYEINPNDYEAGLNFARALRGIGSTRRATEVAAQAMALKPGDVELSKLFAKAAMDQGRPDAAVNVLFTALPQAVDDWTVHSLFGVALDQLGKHETAQKQYAKALQISPENPTVLANLGLSLAMEGRPEEAEVTLRRAVGEHDLIDPRIRQNLALVLGLQGKFQEAAEVASKDLPQGIVDENMAYFRNLLTPPDRNWGARRGAHAESD